MIKYVSLALALVFSGLAFAGGHGHVVVQQQVVQKVIVPQRVVQFDAQYFQGFDHYYSLGEKLKAEKQEEKATEVDYYKGQIELLLKIIAAREGAGGRIIPNATTPEPVLPAPTNPNPEVPPAPPEPVGNGEEEYKVTELDKRVYAIFNASCVRCHGDTKQDGGLALVKGGALQLVDLVDRVEIYDRVLGVGLEARGKAKMPKGGTLSDNDVESLRLWMVQESDRLKNGGK